jgi:photosystem II stability/assembly factor-like uncharacterized protein
MNFICKVILILFLIGSPVLSQQYWTKVNSPASKSLWKCHFVDSLYGWAAGDSGTIVHTSNGGQNWILQNSGIDFYQIDDIFFINHSTGWALSNDFLYTGTIVLRTTNGGALWTNYRYPDTSRVFNVVYFLNPQVGFLTGFSGLFMKTTNGGANWFDTYVDTSFCPLLYMLQKTRLYFINDNTGFAAGGQMDVQGMVWNTTNGGLNWITHCVSAEPIFDITAVSPLKIVGTGGDFEYGMSVIISRDGGFSWEPDVTGIFGRGKSVAFRTPSELWIPLDFSQNFAVNLDSGNIGTHWYEIQAADSTAVFATIFLSPTLGWSFGSKGNILKYNPDVIGIQGNQSIADKFRLAQNYPNPFNPSTVIGYELQTGGIVKIDIFNIQGELVSSLENVYRPAGYHDVLWDAQNMPSGVYFYRLTAGSKSISKKMILLK